ncbi:MAG TPA: lysophospholipid acyltransferase family protein [Myxococcota bacterium]|nr:lysophospholipid acyltransferase family protein [Myxococcota bacterium]
MNPRPDELPPYVDPTTALRALALVNGLRRYHAHAVEGMEHIPAEGPALLVVHHSLATYDILLLGVSIWEHTHRVVRGLADRLIFRLPILSDLARNLGAVQGDPGAARRLLGDGEIVMVAPGGMREALRSSAERYQIAWGNRMGFARLALESGTRLIPAACPAADDLYTVVPNRVTRYLYDTFRVPVPLMHGVGPTPIPRRLPLTHYIGPPITPPAPAASPAERQVQVETLRQRVAEAMAALLAHH